MNIRLANVALSPTNVKQYDAARVKIQSERKNTQVIEPNAFINATHMDKYKSIKYDCQRECNRSIQKFITRRLLIVG